MSLCVDDVKVRDLTTSSNPAEVAQSLMKGHPDFFSSHSAFLVNYYTRRRTKSLLC